VASSEVGSDEDLTRFLVARDFDITKTTDMYKNYLEWWSTTSPRTISDEKISTSLYANKAFVYGYDKQFRPTLYIVTKKHDKNIPIEETRLFISRLIMSAVDLLGKDGTNNQFSAIIDFDDFGTSNFDMKALKSIMWLLDRCFPERLGSLYMVNTGILFGVLWKVVSPFIPARTSAKIKIDDEKELVGQWPPELLLKAYGGTSDYSHDYKAETEGKNKQQTEEKKEKTEKPVENDNVYV